MDIEVKVFGQLTDLTGTAALRICEVRDTDELRALLADRYPPLKDHPYAIAVDRKIISVKTNLESGSVVVLMPPFSGG
jgi:molybdopterin synthase sulfur carrier subunit